MFFDDSATPDPPELTDEQKDTSPQPVWMDFLTSYPVSGQPGTPSLPRLLPPPAAGLPLPRHSQAMALDWTAWDKSLPPEMREANAVQLRVPDPEAEKKRLTNVAFLTEETHLDPHIVNNNYEAVRSSYAALNAKKGWGLAGADDDTFFQKVKAKAQADKDTGIHLSGIEGDTTEAQKTREESAVNKGYATGAGVWHKDTLPEGFQRWIKTHPKFNPDHDPEVQAQAFATFAHGWSLGQADLKAGRHAAAEVYPRIVNPELQDIAEAMPFIRGLTDNQKGLMFGEMKVRAEQDAKTNKEDIGAAVAHGALRGTDNLLSSIAEYAAGPEDMSPTFKEGDSVSKQTLDEKGPEAAALQTRTAVEASMKSGFSAIPPDQVALTKEQADQANAEITQRQGDQKSLRQLKNFAQGTVNPIETGTWYGDVAAHLAQTVPVLALTAVPGGTIPTAMAFIQDAQTGLEDRGVPEGSARVMAPFVGGLQALLFKVNVGLLTKSQGLSEMMGYATSNLTKFADRAITGSAVAGLDMGLQGTLPTVAAKFASEFNAKVPGESWFDINKEFWGNTAQAVSDFWPVVMLTSGFATRADFKNAEALVKQPHIMAALGYKPEHIAAIELADGPQAVALAQRFWLERDKVMPGDPRAKQFEGMFLMNPGSEPPALSDTTTVTKRRDVDVGISKATGTTTENTGNIPASEPPEAQDEAANRQEAESLGITIKEHADGWYVQDGEAEPINVGNDPAHALTARDELVEKKKAEAEEESVKTAEGSEPPPEDQPEGDGETGQPLTEPAEADAPVKPAPETPDADSWTSATADEPLAPEPSSEVAPATAEDVNLNDPKVALVAEYRAIQQELRDRGDFDAVAKLEAKGTTDFYGRTGKLVKRRNEIRQALDENGGGFDEAMQLYSGIPLPRFLTKGFKDRRMSPLDRATASRSAKMQMSTFEANKAKKEIEKAIPNEGRRDAVSVWVEAAGDAATLAGWESRAKNAAFKRAAKLAQSLTPEEIAIARRVQAAFKHLLARGLKYEVLANARDNYVPHVWDAPKPATGFGTRRLTTKLRFAKVRTFENFAEGDQAGYLPKTLDIAKLLPVYIHEMNKVIADKQFIADISKLKASDLRPLVIARGAIREASKEPEAGKTYLVDPRAQKTVKDAAGEEIDQRDYEVLHNQPALHDWRWEGKDTEGNPIFMKDDLALHPEAVRRVNSIMGTSRIRQFFRQEGRSAPVKALQFTVKAVDVAQSTMKREMFGLLSPFHQVQEGTHAVGHHVNPFFGLPELDLKDPAQMDAARHGLMILSDRTTGTGYIEGLGAESSFLTQAARKFGGPAGRAVASVVDGYQNYLFHSYIPRLKIQTYNKILERNTKRYQPEMAKGDLTLSDVKLLSAEQTNAAYGHLNYSLLDRSPTVQHAFQLVLLAPDFLEARLRFTAQALLGVTSKVGREQFRAIAMLAVSQMGVSYTLAQLTGGEWDPRHPFEFTRNGRRFSMRSVPEDILSAVHDWHKFLHGRLSPLIGKGGLWAVAHTNYRGEEQDFSDFAAETLAQYIPMTIRGMPGLKELTETSRNNPSSTLEQLSSSFGLHISHYSPVAETYKTARAWMKAHDMKVETGVYPTSRFSPMKNALEDGDMDRAQKEYDKLAKSEEEQKITNGFRASVKHHFTKDRETDEQFRESLTGKDAALYDRAIEVKEGLLLKFDALKK